MASEEQKLPMVVKVLIGLVILLFLLPILTIGPVLLLTLPMSYPSGRVAPRLIWR